MELQPRPDAVQAKQTTLSGIKLPEEGREDNTQYITKAVNAMEKK